MKHLIVTSALALTSLAAPIAAHADPCEGGVPYAQPVYQPTYVQPVYQQPAYVPPTYATPVRVRRFDRDGDEFRGREGWGRRENERREWRFHEGREGRAWGGARR